MPRIKHQSIKGQTVVISSELVEFDEVGVAEVSQEIFDLVVGKYGYEDASEGAKKSAAKSSEQGKGKDTNENKDAGKDDAGKPKRKPIGGE